MKVGIFFGGPSREREISFAGGRTVYDNLDKTLFEPLPIFVDSHRNLILLEWPYIYKGTIRDFYPPVSELPASPNGFQVYLESLGELSSEQQDRIIHSVGRKLEWEEIPDLIDMAFLALHGVYGEDGQIQGQLDQLNVPYTGSGIKASQIGMDKALQKELMSELGFEAPDILVYERAQWIAANPAEAYEQCIENIGFPMVVRPANQGSSIGVTIVEKEDGLEGFDLAMNRAFFRELIPVVEWMDRSEYERIEYIKLITDIRDGIGFPMTLTFKEQQQTITHPEALFHFLNENADETNEAHAFLLEGSLSEEKVIVESFIRGKEFSCIVVRTETDEVVALPPTEILKGKEVFDYRSKYMPGMSRKLTPINLPDQDIHAIRSECERLFSELDFQVYARIDGFITPAGKIFLNDPNTTSGMLPSSFFFHQAAEIGLTPSQFLTYIVRISIQERLQERAGEGAYKKLLESLDQAISDQQSETSERTKVAVLLGGYSFERHISVESGRNVFEKLSSSAKYEPIPVFLGGRPGSIELYQLPINLLLKDNADDIRDKIAAYRPHPVVETIKEQCQNITAKYASPEVVFAPRPLTFEAMSELVDVVFIGLHGRPGEDGQIQSELDRVGLPYNGSRPDSAEVTINKYQTLQTLKRNGFTVANQLLASREDYQRQPEDFFLKIESQLDYPFVGKPVDDGCSSAVKILRNRKELEAFSRLMFRPENEEGLEARHTLHLSAREEFPRKEEALFEQLIEKKGAKHFLEITGGLLTHYKSGGVLYYEVFEPSETLSSGEVLSLEEKFLAGEGQNITPARFSSDPAAYEIIAKQVKKDLERAARILKVEGYARIDAFVRIFEDNSVHTIIIEVNALPGMTPATCIFHQAALNQYKPYEFIDQILTFGLQRKKGGLPTPPKEPASPVSEPQTAAEVAIPAAAPVDTINIPEAPTATEPEMAPPAAESNGFTPSSNTSYIKERLLEAMSSLAAFLRAPIFLRNFGLILALIFVGFFLLKWSLNLYTRHGESLQIPNFVGMDYEDAAKRARKQNFKLIAIDSFYSSGKPANAIYQQDPKPLQRAKEGRTIYVSKYRVQADSFRLPSLLEAGYSYNRYAGKLKQNDVTAVIKERQFDPKQEENSILFFYFNGKKITDEMLRQGVEIPKGSTLEFVVTERTTNEVAIPNLVCKRYDAANFLIGSSGLELGQIFGDIADRENTYIVRQDPPYRPGVMLQRGQTIDLYLSSSLPAGCGGTETQEPAPTSDELQEGEEEDFN